MFYIPMPVKYFHGLLPRSFHHFAVVVVIPKALCFSFFLYLYLLFQVDASRKKYYTIKLYWKSRFNSEIHLFKLLLP